MGFVKWAYNKGVEGDEAPTIIHNFPDAWVERYRERRYDRVDPVIMGARTQARPFQWSAIFERATETRQLKDYLSEARAVGLFDGIAFALPDPGGPPTVFSAATTESVQETAKMLAALQPDAIAILLAFHAHLEPLIRSSSNVRTDCELSDRERECLLWVMRGKSSWEIGSIINRTPRTVDFHVANAMRKLRAATRLEAAVKALRFGLIQP